MLAATGDSPPCLPFCHAELRAVKPKSECYPNKISILGDHLRCHRLDRNFLQVQVAEQIGVDKTTIRNWESNPRRKLAT
jgi:DNA-binding transcriptional regulator YiaG